MASETPAIRALIVDDEPLARERLHELLTDAPAVTVAGTAEDGFEAVDAIHEQAPDLVFLDVQMPGMNGIDVIEEIGTADMPVTVFVTAYDQYAIKAFDLAAVDYLLKPFDDERFEEALRRAREQIANREGEAISDRLLRLLQERDPSLLEKESARDEPYLERIAVQGRGKARIVPVDDLTHITGLLRGAAHGRRHLRHSRAHEDPRRSPRPRHVRPGAPVGHRAARRDRAHLARGRRQLRRAPPRRHAGQREP
jgi:two-component system LytT family response regulator